MRRLLIVPIVHSQSELGSLASTVSDAKVAWLARSEQNDLRRASNTSGTRLSQTPPAARPAFFSSLLIYQDGLPVIENAALQLKTAYCVRIWLAAAAPIIAWSSG